MGVKTALWAAIEALLKWQESHQGHTQGRCLAAVRAALRTAGLALPQSGVNYRGNLAISCGKRLAEELAKPEGKRNPAWRWKLAGKTKNSLPTDRPSLVFFRDCGRLKDGRIAGHIAIYKPSTNRHIANASYDMTEWWLERIAYVFVPKT